MNGKSLGTFVLLLFVAVTIGYLVVSELQSTTADSDRPQAQTTAADARHNQPGDEPASMATEAPPGATTRPEHKVVAYYFHNTQRCVTCNKIERLAQETLRERFANALQSGELEWRAVNMEESANRHFVEEYQLVTSSLVLVDLHDGEQHDWTNLEAVWQHVHDDEAEFKQYVATQTQEYLES